MVSFIKNFLYCDRMECLLLCHQGGLDGDNRFDLERLEEAQLASAGLLFCQFVARLYGKNQVMSWKIVRLVPHESAIYLANESSGTERKISVPDLLDARMLDTLLVIKAKQYIWEVEPEDGHRRRLPMDLSTHEYLDLFKEPNQLG